MSICFHIKPPAFKDGQPNPAFSFFVLSVFFCLFDLQPSQGGRACAIYSACFPRRRNETSVTARRTVFPAGTDEKAAYGFSGSHQRGLLQMGVAHGRPGIAVSQQLLDLIERVPGIDQKRGEGMPQVMNAHVGKLQTAPQLVPEYIDVTERLSRRMAGEKPRVAWLARNGADNLYASSDSGIWRGLPDLDSGTMSSRKSRRTCSQRALRISLLRAPVSRSRRMAEPSDDRFFPAPARVVALRPE